MGDPGAERITAAQVVPQNVEKLPLWHWRPGARLLVVGDRDGAAFAPDAGTATGRDFDRVLDHELLITAQERAATDGLAAAWRASLGRPAAMDLLRTSCQGALVVLTAGRGEEAVLEALLPRVDAWLLLIAAGEPLDARILAEGRHVEVLVGMEAGAALPQREWERAAAVHLVPRRTAAMVGSDLLACEAAVRRQLPSTVPCYGVGDRHTHCPACGEVLVWRSGGRSRSEDLLGADGRCRACGAAHGVVVTA